MQQTEREVMKRTRDERSSGAQGEDRLEAVREQVSVIDLTQRYESHPNRIYTWKKQLLEQAVRAFFAGGWGRTLRRAEIVRSRSCTPRSGT